MERITIEVIKTPFKSYGYSLKHNQMDGFKGIIGKIWAWYRYKSDAIKASKELSKCWNK